MLHPNVQTPIEYKTIPTQYAFYVHKDGRLQIQPVSTVPKELQFKSEAEAREYIKNYKQQL